MAVPTVITVNGTLTKADNTPETGHVYFYSDVNVLSSGDDTVMVPSYLSDDLDEDGHFTLDVPASNDPDWTPEGWTYKVVVHTPNFKHEFLSVIPFDAPGGEIDFSQLVPALDGGSELYAAYNHTHEGIGDSAVTSVAGRTGDVVLTKTDVGLANVDNTSDASKPVSTVQQTALDLKAPLASPTFTGTVSGITKSMVGLGNVDNTSDANKPVSTATATALSGKSNTGHSHAISDVTSLQTALDAKAALVHGHVISDTTGLQTALDGKALTVHTHTIAQVTDLQTQLDGKQAAGSYLVASDISNLVSDDTFTEGMNQKLDNTNGVTALFRRSSPGAPTTGSWVVGNLVLDSLGILWYCTVSGTPGTWTTRMQPGIVAADHNFAAWSFEPDLIQGSLAQITAGLSYVARIKNPLSSAVSNIHMHLTAGGGSLTSGQCFASVHNDAGTQLGITGTLHSTGAGGWGDGGFKTLPIVGAPITVTPGTWLKVRWWWNGSTGPVISRAVNSSGVITGAGLANPNFRFSTADASLTTTGPGTIGTMTASPTAYWVALS
jgi:hypothetical protein